MPVTSFMRIKITILGVNYTSHRHGADFPTHLPRPPFPLQTVGFIPTGNIWGEGNVLVVGMKQTGVFCWN